MTDTSNGRAVDGRDKKTGQFLMGHKGNGGRPPGSRNKLGEKFLEDLHAKWRKHGKDVLERVIKDDPSSFLRVVAQILPREFDTTLNVNVGLFTDIRDHVEAYRLARQHIGVDEKLIEAQENDA
jgi:hypothetical protein